MITANQARMLTTPENSPLFAKTMEDVEKYIIDMAYFGRKRGVFYIRLIDNKDWFDIIEKKLRNEGYKAEITIRHSKFDSYNAELAISWE